MHRKHRRKKVLARGREIIHPAKKKEKKNARDEEKETRNGDLLFANLMPEKEVRLMGGKWWARERGKSTPILARKCEKKKGEGGRLPIYCIIKKKASKRGGKGRKKFMTMSEKENEMLGRRITN